MNNLILCPQCQQKGFKQILGNLTPEGLLLIRRGAHGTTIIQATNLTLGCGCGYVVAITEGQATHILTQ